MAFGLGRKHSADDDIKKLSRSELLEMLIEQTRLADRLRERNKKLTKELAVCKANLEKAASLRLIIARLERIERLSAAHAGLTDEEIAELLAMGRKRRKAAPEKADESKVAPTMDKSESQKEQSELAEAAETEETAKTAETEEAAETEVTRSAEIIEEEEEADDSEEEAESEEADDSEEEEETDDIEESEDPEDDSLE